MDHLLDVVVPVRNAAGYLPTFLATVRANSPAGCRYLIIDDGSTDGTWQLLSRARRELPQLEVHRLDQPRGVAAARNLALSLLSAPLVGFYDVDDWLAPGRWAELIAAQRRTGAAIVRTDHVRVNAHRRSLTVAPGSVRETAVSTRAEIGDAGGQSLVDYPFLWAGIFDATQVPFAQLSFDEELRTASDRPWFWRLFLRDLTVAVVDAPAYFYRRTVGSSSLTEHGHERLLDIFPAMHKVLNQAQTSPVAAHRRRAAYTCAVMVDLHLSRRARLNAELQRRLIIEGARLMARIDPDDLQAAVAELGPQAGPIAQQLHQAGRRWAA